MLGGVGGVGAGIASRWLLLDGTAAAVAVIGVIACALLVLAPRASLLVVIAATLTSSVAVQLPGFTIEGASLSMIAGLLAALGLVGPLAIAASIRQQRAFQRRGWELAALEAHARSRDVQAAVQRERMSLTADMHDGLGHRLTLLAVRLGQLSLSPTLAPADRAAVAELRRAAGDAAEELGLAVRLLSDSATASRSVAPDLEETIASARTAGIPLSAEIATDLAAKVTPEVRAAAVRLVQEGLANASKHAPGEPVDIAIRVDGAEMVAEIGNALPTTTDATPHAGRYGGYGLAGLQHRAALLGGSLTVDRASSRFSLTLTVPTDARHTPAAAPGSAHLRAAHGEATGDRTKATRVAIALPIGILGAMLGVAAAYVALATTLSILPPADLAAIEPGDDRAAVERALPPFELLDAPTERFPALDGEECRYYESELSPFERRDVHVVCFDATSVTRTGIVPAP